MDTIDKNTKYFLIDELGYYVRYQDVSKMDKLTAKDLRYKNYLPFNYIHIIIFYLRYHNFDLLNNKLFHCLNLNLK